MISRRDFIKLTATGLALPQFSWAKNSKPAFDYTLVAEEAAVSIIPGTRTPALTFNGRFPAPILRAKQGMPLRVKLINHLQQPTTIHWHGIRLANAMDGVPYLTQPPVQPGESFIYDFVCPDAGTFWYHPHSNSVEQLGKGMVGVLIVEEKDTVDFDHEIILGLKDWHLDKQGQFLPLTDKRHAARMGTLGNLSTVNGKQQPVYEVPAAGAVRVRIVNLDNTRVFNLSLKQELAAQVLAIDGAPVNKPYELTTYALGPGMRVDLGLITPSKEQDIIIYDQKGDFHFEVCKLKTVKSKLKLSGKIPVLPANPFAKLDLARAQTEKFVFEWSGQLSTIADSNKEELFWTINRHGWQCAEMAHIPQPLARLKLGNTYIFELNNITQHVHPIHLHGHIFTVLDSNQKTIQPYQADTVLLDENEKVKIAFVADNPGNWMLHCHIIEHMQTGMMGYISVI